VSPAAGVLRGAHAQVKAAYLTAAELTGYTLARDELTGAWFVHGTVVTSDAYLLAQAGLVFVAPHKGGAWRWVIESFAIAGPAFEARLKALT
jgi:hypothetical protein